MSMTNDQILSEIQTCNLNYLILVQSLLRDDFQSGLYRAGMCEKVGEIVRDMSIKTLQKLANSNALIARMRFDDPALLHRIANMDKDQSLINAQMAMITQYQPLNLPVSV